MPTGGKKPTSASLSEVLEGLLEAEIDFILVGGLAAVIQGAPVTTKDPKDKQRLPVLKETLRQLEKEYGREEDEEDGDR